MFIIWYLFSVKRNVLQTKLLDFVVNEQKLCNANGKIGFKVNKHNTVMRMWFMTSDTTSLTRSPQHRGEACKNLKDDKVSCKTSSDESLITIYWWQLITKVIGVGWTTVNNHEYRFHLWLFLTHNQLIVARTPVCNSADCNISCWPVPSEPPAGTEVSLSGILTEKQEPTPAVHFSFTVQFLRNA